MNPLGRRLTALFVSSFCQIIYSSVGQSQMNGLCTLYFQDCLLPHHLHLPSSSAPYLGSSAYWLPEVSTWMLRSHLGLIHNSSDYNFIRFANVVFIFFVTHTKFLADKECFLLATTFLWDSSYYFFSRTITSMLPK